MYFRESTAGSAIWLTRAPPARSRVFGCAYRRDFRRDRALRGAVPVARPAGVDSSRDRGSHPVAGPVQRHAEQQLQVPARQRAQPTCDRPVRAVRHGQLHPDPGRGGQIRVGPDLRRRRGHDLPAEAAGHGARRRPGAGRGPVRRRPGRAARGAGRPEQRQRQRNRQLHRQAAREDRAGGPARRAERAPGRRRGHPGRPAEGVGQPGQQDPGPVDRSSSSCCWC